MAGTSGVGLEVHAFALIEFAEVRRLDHGQVEELVPDRFESVRDRSSAGHLDLRGPSFPRRITSAKGAAAATAATVLPLWTCRPAGPDPGGFERANAPPRSIALLSATAAGCGG
jgi:hypothetical protein